MKCIIWSLISCFSIILDRIYLHRTINCFCVYLRNCIVNMLHHFFRMKQSISNIQLPISVCIRWVNVMGCSRIYFIYVRSYLDSNMFHSWEKGWALFKSAMALLPQAAIRFNLEKNRVGKVLGGWVFCDVYIMVQWRIKTTWTLWVSAWWQL